LISTKGYFRKLLLLEREVLFELQLKHEQLRNFGKYGFVSDTREFFDNELSLTFKSIQQCKANLEYYRAILNY